MPHDPPTTGPRNDPLVPLGSPNAAAHAATWGAIHGAVKWGLISAFAVTGASILSPVVRGLTIQFRVYLWMCPTAVGSMVEADRRLVRYEHEVRRRRRELVRDVREAEMRREMEEVEALERAARRRREKEKE
ncbi:hypothetical protein EX30DRAFT_339339 [Ascodesmis nigricans]|uniref:Uncharacterized protein n=1 Tax=Ascodesmis nigricans TaxID=341454 RepID=A0A4S2N1T4_9PEZI|nr:hypothetical protein EX30DRAFT_339339 [Ascodesmis nigricans]